MNRKGCDIEATGINYTIYTQKPQPPFKIFNKDQQFIELQPHQHQKSFSDPAPDTNPRARRVLRDVSCHAKPWEVLAIVGPSGAGKSSLLEILAGKITPQTSRICVNRKPVDKSRFKKISGYVTQKDTLFPLLTVEETLVFTAKLRLKLPKPELSSRVRSLIQELGLTHVANARVGDDRVRGISGGERRRVSIGVAVVHDPEVVILDEPTSGLDSNSAFQIIDMVKTMAETRGKTVVLSIHQPGFRIIKLFNSILLLANGTVLHQGTVDELNLSLRLIGLEPPLHVNIVEFAIDSIDTIQEQKNQKTSNLEQEPTAPTNRITQVLFATPLYWLVGLNHSFLAFSRFLLLIWLILYTANSVVVCFSALVPNFIIGNSVISGVMGSFFLFSGYFVSEKGMPKYWIFMHYISLFKYPFEGLLMNEFSGGGEGRCLEELFGKCLVTGEDLLREQGGYRKEGKWKNFVIMVCFILVYRFISYVILRVRCSQKGT
ncbi:ABC transporter G family member 5 [Cynara cardunculus var. scolymus]|uniref:ABC transporter G family member 5 n=1 Tax=Cynara cardunculus var. scolymus TaxID=59895 RepID=UPI000D62FBDB|nr:ABC transporter G family member 5 [Cynara cardunculus var. scolymus]